MIKEALSYLQSLGMKEKIQIDDHRVGIKHGHSYDTAEPWRPMPKFLVTKTLSSFVDYLNSGFDDYAEKELMIQVRSPWLISLFGKLNDKVRDRDHLLSAEYDPSDYRSRMSIENFLNNYHSLQQFNIYLQTNFVPSEDRDAVTRFTSGITDSNIKTATDDGVSQAVAIRTGISKVEECMVPSPAVMAPYRTFTEVAQPSSAFLLRLQKARDPNELPRAALMEADGGGWKAQAIQNIKEWFTGKVPTEVLIIA